MHQKLHTLQWCFSCSRRLYQKAAFCKLQIKQRKQRKPPAWPGQSAQFSASNGLRSNLTEALAANLLVCGL